MLLTITDIWQQASTLEKTYWIFAVPATLFFLVILVTTFFGGDGMDASPDDLDTDVSSGVAGQYFTIKNLIGFFLLFSWTGIACLKGGVGTALSVVLSLAAGIIMMVVMAWLFRSMSKMAESGTLKMANALGRTASVYMRIPGSRGGMGKVQITIQGSLRELDALTDHSDDLPTGTIVRVAEIIDGHLLRVDRIEN